MAVAQLHLQRQDDDGDVSTVTVGTTGALHDSSIVV